MARNRYNNNYSELSQIDRKLPELDIDYVHPNEFTNEELINYCFKFSKFLNYYNEENKIEGNWQEFYGSNFSIILSLLEQVDFYSYRKQFKQIFENIQSSIEISDAKEALQYLFTFLSDFLNDIEQIYELLISIDIFAFDDKFKKIALEEIVFYRNQLNGWKGEATTILKIGASEQENIEINFTEWVTESDFNIFKTDGDDIEKIKNGVLPIQIFFNELISKARLQILVKKNSLKNKISLQSNEEYYTPNLALIKTFTEVYSMLKEKNNLITKRHLDFYYKNVLSQKSVEAEEDNAHLVIFPGSNYDSFLLKKNTLFTANFDNTNLLPIVYENKEDVLINQSLIKKVINLSLSYTANNTIEEKSLFTKHIDITNPQEGIGNHQMAVFGNNQTFIPDDSYLKMHPAEIGFYLGAKILYQPNGDRIVNVIFYFEKNSFLQVQKFIFNYSQKNNRDLLILSNDLFRSAFNIFYSNKNGWLPFENFTVTIDPYNTTEYKVEYNFKLSNEDPSFDNFNNTIHGSIGDTTIPVLKFIINPNSFFNGYNFLKDLIIERLFFQVIVKNDTNISLRNNFGNISAENPFQIFGPTPNMQSFLDIQNENIFNKYTKDFIIHLNWFDLPINENGLKEYYKEYQSDIENASFKIGISSLNKGIFVPTIQEQQIFNLFESFRVEDKVDFLSTKTTLNSIDFSKIKFSNEMNLRRQEIDLINRHSKGILRISLLNPVLGFGHKLFSKLFSQISLNNSKWFKRKRNLPNEPISPSLKSISLDYILESNELLSASSKNLSESSNIIFTHIHPYGYEKMYPNQSKSLYSFVPIIDSDNQFIIGIDKIFPGQELNIYFELEEIKSKYNINDNYYIQWFYLASNIWKPIVDKNILSDTTNNLIQSGIVKFITPIDINNKNTIFNDDLYYLKVTIKNVQNFKKKLKNIFINGVLIERIFSDSNYNEIFSLPEKSIDKPFINQPEIDTVLQPYRNFNGRQKENEDNFYVRISEMLRTKNRFITVRDITQAILKNFSNISLVECLGNGFQDSINKNIDLIITLIPKFTRIETYDVDNFPIIDTELLFQVKKYVQNLISDDIQLTISNPIYEKVKVICEVSFKEVRGTQDIKIFTNLLNQDIIEFIAPWIKFGSEDEIIIDNMINTDELIDYIKNKPYIDTVFQLSIIHIYPVYNDNEAEPIYRLFDTAVTNARTIKTSLINSIFLPVNNHQIVVHDLNKKSRQNKLVGINELEIGKELIIQENAIFNESVIENQNFQQKSNKFTLTLKL
jgi:hypothetical protein